MKNFVTFYHGTTIENVKKLVQSNWDWTSKPAQNWSVSMPDMVYTWCGPAVSLLNWDEVAFSKLQQDNWRAIQYALGNAQIAAAIQNSRYDDLAVLGYFEEITMNGLPEEYDELQNLIEDGSQWMSDSSAENMQGAFETSVYNLQNRTPDVIYIGEKTYSPMLRGVLIPLDNSVCLTPELTQIEEKIINILRSNEELNCLSVQLLDESEVVEFKTLEDIQKYLNKEDKT